MTIVVVDLPAVAAATAVAVVETVAEFEVDTFDDVELVVDIAVADVGSAFAAFVDDCDMACYTVAGVACDVAFASDEDAYDEH